jgi:hypothetical protein
MMGNKTRAKLKNGVVKNKIVRCLQVGLLAAVALLLFGIMITSFIPPSLTLSKDTVFFGAEDEGVATPPQKISIVIQNKAFGAHRDLLWKARPQKDWLIVRPATGRGAGGFEIRPLHRRLPPGTYRATVAVTCRGTRNSPKEIPVVLNIVRKGASAPPFGWLDYPPNGTTVRGDQLEVWGWALDDIEVTEVKIKRTPFPNEDSRPIDPDGLIPVGKAKLMKGARPDVEKAFARYPLNSRAGWWFSLPLGDLPPETVDKLTIHAVLTDKEGSSTDLNSTTVKLAR